jgi:hypothetical protein
MHQLDTLTSERFNGGKVATCNMTISMLIRVAQALDSRVEIKLVRRKGTKAGRRRNGGGKVKSRSR